MQEGRRMEISTYFRNLLLNLPQSNVEFVIISKHIFIITELSVVTAKLKEKYVHVSKDIRII